MDRQTLRDWVRRYNAEGVEGLDNRRGGGMKLRLTSDQLATWVADGPDPERDGVVRWRRWISRVGSRWFSASNFMSAR